MKFITKIFAFFMALLLLATSALAEEFMPSPGKGGVTLIEGDVTITNSNDANASERFKDAISELENKGLEDILEGFGEMWKKTTGAPLANAEVTKTFDVVFEGGPKTFKVSVVGLEAGFMVIAKDHKTGEWYYVEYTVDGNVLTITLNSSATIAIVEDNCNPPIVDNPIQSPQTNVTSFSPVLIVSSVVALVGAIFFGKKHLQEKG